MSLFCRFSASFSLKYDVTDAILQDSVKMKVQYLLSLVFDLLETLQAVKTKEFRFIVNLVAVATKIKTIVYY